MDFKHIYFLASICVLTGCASPATQLKESELTGQEQLENFRKSTEVQLPSPLKLDRKTRLPSPEPTSTLAADESEQKYSFTISNMQIKEGLRMFARAYNLNISVDQNVVGVIDVEFFDLPLKQAIPMMLGDGHYYWKMENGIIKIRSSETRQFTVDYLRLIRNGVGSSSATVSSGTNGEGRETGTVAINHSDSIQFWEELEVQIKALLSAAGRVVVNRLSGTVVVTDQHAYVNSVANFLDDIQLAIHRQVDIQVSIIEVSLDDNSALGVNWSRIADAMDLSDAVSLNINGTVETPAGGVEPKNDVINLAYENTNSGNKVSALVSALAEQGNVQVVSQPHIRTINNQTSLIKVGTDRTFFRREQSTDSTSAGSITTATDVAQVVTEGVVVSITPQISASGWILMDISPVVTRVSSVATVQDSSGQIQSSAPNLDVAQVTSLVRAQSGETVVIGGLIQSQESTTERHVPGTKWLGPMRFLAGGKYVSHVKKELIMVVTPIIVNAQ